MKISITHFLCNNQQAKSHIQNISTVFLRSSLTTVVAMVFVEATLAMLFSEEMGYDAKSEFITFKQTMYIVFCAEISSQMSLFVQTKCFCDALFGISLCQGFSIWRNDTHAAA